MTNARWLCRTGLWTQAHQTHFRRNGIPTHSPVIEYVSSGRHPTPSTMLAGTQLTFAYLAALACPLSFMVGVHTALPATTSS